MLSLPGKEYTYSEDKAALGHQLLMIKYYPTAITEAVQHAIFQRKHLQTV